MHVLNHEQPIGVYEGVRTKDFNPRMPHRIERSAIAAAPKTTDGPACDVVSMGGPECHGWVTSVKS